MSRNDFIFHSGEAQAVRKQPILNTPAICKYTADLSIKIATQPLWPVQAFSLLSRTVKHRDFL